MDSQNSQFVPHTGDQILSEPINNISLSYPNNKTSMQIKYKLLMIAGFSALTISFLSVFLYLSSKSFNLTIIYFVGGLIVALILDTAVAILLLSNSTSESITKLTEGIEMISEGNLDYKINVQPQDAVGELSSSLNKMTAKLKASHAVREEKIQEVTNALARKSEELENERQKSVNIEKKAFIDKAEAEATLTSIGEGVVVTNPEGKILIFNQAAEQMTHWKSSEVVGNYWFEIVPAVDENGILIPRKDRDMYKALITGNKVFAHSIYLQKGATKVFVAVTATPIVLNGQITGAVEVFRNIGRELEVDRMKSEFISLASHQLRTPLSASKWFSEMLINGDAGELNPEQKEYVGNIFDSNERMISLVNSLLNISRIESGRIIINPKITDINKLVSEVITEVKIKSDLKKQQIIFSIHSNLPLINIDPILIREVYVNLLTNASKYTPEGGEISIFVSKKDNELISQVSDNGYGIPKKDYSKVFQKFYRAENIIKIETDGNGLGLYLTKAIIESSGGKIWFESTENKGTSFYFSIPLSGMKARIGEVSLDT